MVRLVDRPRWRSWLFVGFSLALVSDSASAGATPRGVLTLEEALAAALADSPALAGTSSELGIRDAEVDQASRRPNPEIELEQENFAGTGEARAWHEAESTLGVMVPLELGEKRAQRVEVAVLDRRMTEWDHRELRHGVRLATAEAFVRTLAAQERLARAREAVELEKALGVSVERGVRAGAVSEVDAGRASLAVKRAEGEVDRRARELAAARLALASSWGESEAAFESVRGDFTALTAPPPLEELLAKVEELPAVSRWQDELTRRRAALALEDTRATPDLRFGVGVRHLAADDDVALVASVSLPLPLFDRNQGAIEAARGAAERGVALEAAARFESRAAARALHHDLGASHARADHLLRSILPDAEAVHREAREAYQRGLFRLTDVLETERTLLELRLELIDELERHHRAAAALRAIWMKGGQP